jgi:DNA-binding response OmpR family regulator
MSKQWHILIVLDEEYLNQNIVNSLQIDGYVVKGVTSATEAVHLLWTEEYDIVVSDQKMPDSDGFELLQWMRTYRPNTRMVMIGMSGSSVTRTQALENGVVSYLEKPLDLHTLKVELRRLLQQTGFSASLDSFDLLDVIQIVNMSHKTIAMVVNTGLEEQGLLGFQAGELVWAEYGILRGEEAFFALAAHKNGTITHQPWNAQIIPNVTQPLSRLILRALQYRSKYAEFQQRTGEHAALSPEAVSQTIQSLEDADAPFVFVEPISTDSFQQGGSSSSHETPVPVPVVSNETIEWWQEAALQEQSQKINAVRPEIGSQTLSDNPSTKSEQHVLKGAISGEPGIIPAKAHKTSAGQRTDLPSWLIDQPTQFEMPAIHPSSAGDSNKVPAAPNGETNSPEKQAKKTTRRFAERLKVELNTHKSSYEQSTQEWQFMEEPDASQLQSLTSTRRTADFSAPPSQQKRNYASLTTALQSLVFSIPGFIATALVNVDGQPIVQMVVGDQDISQICDYFGSSMKGVLQALEVGAFGHFEDTIITSLTHFILFRLVGGSRDIFQVLIVTRDMNPVECLEIMANTEPALEAAL